MAFLYARILWVLFIVEVPPCGWGWTSGLSRFLSEGRLCLCSGGWSCISSLWGATKCPVVSFVVSMGLVWLWAVCVLVLMDMFLCCWRISMIYLALKLVVSWVELDFSVYGGFWMSSCQLIFPVVRSSLVFSSFGFKPPASGFQSYSSSSLKTSPAIQHRY